MNGDTAWAGGDYRVGPGNPAHYTCPRCGAGQEQRCRTLSGTNRATDTHAARWDLVDRWVAGRNAVLRAEATRG